MRFSEVRGHEVVSTATATRVGRVSGLVLAAQPARIAALRVSHTQGPGTLLRWADLGACGPDAVTVESAERILLPEDSTERSAAEASQSLLGRRVLDEQGNSRGRLVEIDFDASTGKVNILITDREEVPGALLLGVGSYALVVAAPTETRRPGSGP